MEYLNIDNYEQEKIRQYEMSIGSYKKLKRKVEKIERKPRKEKRMKMYIIENLKSEMCPKCHNPMQRRKRVKPPIDKTYFFTEWDYCRNCRHVQHYEKYKSTDWKERETQENHLFDIRKEV